MRIQVAALLLCLAGGPSHALTFSTSGPGLVPCGDQMCVDVSWNWEGSTTDSSGQIALVLPIPDSELWELSSGSLFSPISGASFGGWFDSLEVEQVTDPPQDTFVGISVPEYLVLGANGSMLTRNVTTLAASCVLPPSEPTITCSDGRAMGGSEYSAVPGDDAFLGPLTLRYDFDPDWEIIPLSELYGVSFSGSAHLIYDRIVPEPGTGLLVMTGLLGIAYWQGRHGRAV